MDQNAKRIGLINWVTLLAAAGAMVAITRFVSSAAGAMGAALAGFGMLVALLSYFQMGLVERERFEQLEMEELSKTRGGQSLFATADADTFPARRSREQFEKWVIPAFSACLFAAQAMAAWWPWRRLPAMEPFSKDRATLAMALLGLLALALFLLGKYSGGLARLQGHRLLRPGSAYLLLTAYVCFGVTATFAAVLAGFSAADLIVGRIFCVVAGLIALETLLALVLEVYRVRVKNREARLLYDSRLVGLLGQPEAIFSTAAHALDYQFGFKVSETWFYRMLEKALGWMLLAQLAILIASTSMVIIEPGDEALIERFGKPADATGVIGPGLHFKLPWPIDKTYFYHTDRIQTFIVGSEPERGRTILWTVAHSKEENFLVASRERQHTASTRDAGDTNAPPVNLLSVSIPVQYQITNLATWAYVNEDPPTLLQAVATREVMHYLASADLEELMSRGRERAGETLRDNIQSRVDESRLGVRILFVGLEDIHPPVKVAKIYEQVVGAGQTREAKILGAQAHALSTNAWSRGETAKILGAAEAYEHRAITNAVARADLFQSQMLAYQAAPGENGVYEERAYLETLVNASAKSRKYVLGTTNNEDIVIYDLADKIRPELLEGLQAPTDKK